MMTSCAYFGHGHFTVAAFEKTGINPAILLETIVMVPAGDRFDHFAHFDCYRRVK